MSGRKRMKSWRCKELQPDIPLLDGRKIGGILVEFFAAGPRFVIRRQAGRSRAASIQRVRTHEITISRSLLAYREAYCLSPAARALAAPVEGRTMRRSMSPLRNASRNLG